MNELKRLRALQEAGESEEAMLRRMWRTLMCTEADHPMRDTRWLDYQKFRAEVYMMMMHGLI